MSRPFSSRVCRSASLAVVLTGLLAEPMQAQQPDPVESAQQPEPRPGAQDQITKLVTLRTLADSLVRLDREIDAAGEAARSANTDGARLEAANRLQQLESERRELRQDFDTIATGVDLDQFATPEAAQFHALEELESLLRPLIQELKDATAEPRQIEALRTEFALQDERSKTAARAVEQLEEVIEQAEQPELLTHLRRSLEDWRGRAETARNRATVARFQLEQRLGERRSLFDSTGSFFERFFRSRGLNLLLGLGALVVVLFGLRLLYRPIHSWIVRRHRGARPFYLRVIAAAFWVGSLVLATAAMLMVFWATSDWLLLGLALIFLLGLAWASREALPRFFEHIRLFLNVGAVREGERIVVDGIPWRVRSLNVYTRLENPALSGGSLRLPLHDLVGERSRPCTNDEIWFPCHEADWVELSDGVRGRVVHQSPEFVQLVMLGGARQTYPTAAFLELNPRNLSANFRLRVAFGVDYQHQSIVTREIPAKMQAVLEENLADAVGADELIHLTVEFAEAGASSLDIHVLADFTGSVAARYESLRRTIQRSLVDACNEQGWVIPFMQVTVHQASEGG